MRGPETEKSHEYRLSSGFYHQWMSGTGLDIGYKGSLKDAEPVLTTARGIDTDYPSYDGKHLTFCNESQGYVFSSHCLEHITDYNDAITEWFRVLCVGGFLIIIVPHRDLYEKKFQPPSRWNGDHKRFYTPGSLLNEIEESLETNTYRIRHLADNDRDFTYELPEDVHSGGCYEIECVIEKIK